MQEMVTKCDVCKKPKGTTNHWWRAKVVGETILILPHSETAARGDADLCGRECLHKWIDSQLNELSKSEGA